MGRQRQQAGRWARLAIMPTLKAASSSAQPQNDRTAALLRRLEDLIRAETAQQREALERQWSLPLGERVAEERAELAQEHTRKLYMAFTRAGQRLVLTYVGDLPPVFQALQKYNLVEVLT
ncbi:MAG TPA: hypothetical protein PKH77_21370 [Anaerolineae bacterium]|nr:hypothetical protein [Anaerolineae bacterium]